MNYWQLPGMVSGLNTGSSANKSETLAHAYSRLQMSTQRISNHSQSEASSQDKLDKQKPDLCSFLDVLEFSFD